jgi:heme-degrading monooxygenase HmoA
MGLKDLFSRWTKGEERRATERAERESGLTPYERDVDQEDFEARKDDVAAGSTWAGREAEGAASGELDDH